MIEFKERFFPDGSISASLRAEGLPAGMSYTIMLWADGKCSARSKGYGNGSVRYYDHRTYDEALAHGFQWGKRKIAEAKRIRRRNSESIDAAIRDIQNSPAMRKMASLFGSR